MLDELAARYFSGREVYGDDFSPAEINQWYEDERHAYFDMATSRPYRYGYHALNRLHCYDVLKDRKVNRCLAFGCAHGDELESIAHLVGEFVCVEPVRQWWRPSIGGTPAEYRLPDPAGPIPVETASCELITCLGVLHHIPNISHTLAEFARVLKPAGLLMLREPICTMGDWRKPRRNLTARERGFPLAWLLEKLQSSGFDLARLRYCRFPLSSRIGWLMPRPAFNSMTLSLFDWLCASMWSWNLYYHRDRPWKKIAPIDVSIVATRRKE